MKIIMCIILVLVALTACTQPVPSEDWHTAPPETDEEDFTDALVVCIGIPMALLALAVGIQALGAILKCIQRFNRHTK